MKQPTKDYWYIVEDTTKLVTADWKKIPLSKDFPKNVYSWKPVKKQLKINNKHETIKKIALLT